MAEPVPWLADYALRAGLRYEPEPDERWMRVWEPYVTLRTPIRYEHALSTTAVTIARFVLAPRPGFAVGDEGWIAIAQDERLAGRAAATSDASPIFRDDAVSLPRHTTGDAAFDAVFASYAESSDALKSTINASVRKLALGWRAPVHFEIRAGGFVLAPTALRPDAPSLGWLIDVARLFAEKAARK
ncbi:MAG TPA: hypothetical protein VGH28_11895 [Polyangiaceae bacterium]|jgi:hypothetical protein